MPVDISSLLIHNIPSLELQPHTTWALPSPILSQIGQLETRLLEQLEARLEGRLLEELKELKALLQPHPSIVPQSRDWPPT